MAGVAGILNVSLEFLKLLRGKIEALKSDGV
jgi:hypothetical protein